jgi:hypothetical protein
MGVSPMIHAPDARATQEQMHRLTLFAGGIIFQFLQLNRFQFKPSFVTAAVDVCNSSTNKEEV